jgi:methyl-accepting chemotaxis protein
LGQWFISSKLHIDSTTELQLLGGQIVLHVFLFFFLGYCVVKYVREPLNAAMNELRNVLQGNFDNELDVSVGDEVGDMCCEVTNMQTYLRMLVDEIAASARAINHLSAQLDSQVSGVAENAQFEQQQVKAIFNTMEQFRSSVVEVAQMADVSLGDARATQHTVEENNRNMDLSIAAAGKVSDTVQASSKTISDLRVSIQKIGTISNAIKDIAEQTNLLALNAAIEAARAGEQGRGFAVVADEVRKLAERTATSTKDIAVTIDEINSISGSAVQSMHDAVTEVETSIGLIRKNGEGLKEIMLATVNVSDRVHHIATASGQQSAASGSVADSLQQISNLVDSNTQSVSEAKTATEALARSATDLRKAGYPLTKCAIN